MHHTMKTKLFNAIAGTAVIGISLFTTIPAKASITYYSKTGTLIFKNDGISTSTAYTFTGRIYRRHSDPSFANPITLANIRTVPIKESKIRLNKSIKAGASDERWSRNNDGSFIPRFGGGVKYGDRLSASSISDKGLTAISVLIDEKYLELAVRALHKAFLTENG